jgi:hypothetical protein
MPISKGLHQGKKGKIQDIFMYTTANYGGHHPRIPTQPHEWGRAAITKNSLRSLCLSN